MNAIEDIRAILRLHSPELCEQFHISSIAVFGSVARGDQTPSSDVDILVDFDQPIGWEIVHLQLKFEEILGLKVDLFTRNAVVRKPLLWEVNQRGPGLCLNETFS